MDRYQVTRAGPMHDWDVKDFGQKYAPTVASFQTKTAADAVAKAMNEEDQNAGGRPGRR